MIQSRGRLLRASLWIPIVLGCALPLLVSLWDSFSIGDSVGAIVGVAAWAVLMMLMDMRLLEPGASSTSRLLMASAAFLMVLEWITIAAFSETVLFGLYIPAFVFAFQFPTGIRFLPDSGSALVLTLICGAQALGLVYAFGSIARALQRRLSPSKVLAN
jgi:hypothetical protein